jgi:hypothetical protein
MQMQIMTPQERERFDRLAMLENTPRDSEALLLAGNSPDWTGAMVGTRA